MSLGRKTGGRDFEKGNKLSPGRPKMPEDIKESRKYNKFEIERILTKFLSLNKTELMEIIRDPESDVLNVLVGSILVKAIQMGDQVRLNFLLDRIIGKVPNNVEMVVDTVKRIRNFDGTVTEYITEQKEV